MRIGIIDNWIGKFSSVLAEHWTSQGHTVIQEPGYNPNIIETCDRVFFESADTNIHLATQNRPHKKGKVFVRIVDIDAWVNGPAGIQSGYVDGVIYIAKHIQEHCKKFQNLDCPQHLVPMGLDVNKFSFRQRKSGNEIAFISSRVTAEKGFDIALQILADLRKESQQYQLHVVGQPFENALWQKTIEHIMKVNDLHDAVHFYGQVESIDKFLDDKDYLLLPSKKEAFSFVTAEACAKGIKPVVWNFLGAGDVWPSSYLFNTPSEAVESILSDVYDSHGYRQYIEQNYSLKQHLTRMDNVMEI